MKESWQEIAKNMYPLALAAVPVLCSYAVRGAASQPPTVILWPLTLSLMGGCTVMTFFWLIFKNSEKAALLSASIFMAVFISLYLILIAILLGMFGLNVSALFTLPVFVTVAALVLVAGIVVVVRNQTSRVTRVVRPLCWYFLILQLIAIGLSVATFIMNLNKMRLCPQPVPGSTFTGKLSAQERPDFYYIILDGYGNPKTYKERFNYDNSKFIDRVEKLGFKLVRNSFSNYAFTELSVCSTVNLTYLDKFIDWLGRDSAELTIPCWYLEDNEIVKLMRQNGYKVVNLGGPFGPTAWNFFANQNVPSGPFDMFSVDLWQTSLLGIIETAVHGHFSVDFYRWSIDNIFHNIDQATSIAGPKFVFAHVMIPHPPFAFSADGGYSKAQVMAFGWGNPGATAYIEQSKYTETQIMPVLEHLVERAGKNSIIVVQSDHGPEFDEQAGDDDDVYCFHRMLIFNAFKVPESIKLPEEMSSVNTFRLLFNQVFGCNFPILENRAFLSSPNTPYKFMETTSIYDKFFKGSVPVKPVTDVTGEPKIMSPSGAVPFNYAKSTEQN